MSLVNPGLILKKEPAVARANRNEFDACRQTIDRLDSLLMCGHEIDKIEFILEGGTYTEYPVEYLERFHRDLIYSCNTYFDKEKREPKTISEEIYINKTAREFASLGFALKHDQMRSMHNGLTVFAVGV